MTLNFIGRLLVYGKKISGVVLALLLIGTAVFASRVSAPTIQPFDGSSLQVGNSNTILGKSGFRIAVYSSLEAITQEFGENSGFTTETRKELVKREIVISSAKYGVDENLITKIVQCESGFNMFAVGDSGKAASVAQFHYPTFKRYCSGNYWDYRDQLDCMVRMVKMNLGYNWSCY